MLKKYRLLIISTLSVCFALALVFMGLQFAVMPKNNETHDNALFSIGDTEVSINLSKVLATANVTNVLLLKGNPSNTFIVLTWTPPTITTNVTIRYRTDTFPTGPANGTSAYAGSGFQCTVSNLTAGQVYYFAEWDDSDATQETHLVMSTTAVAIPSGAAGTSTQDLPTPTLPANALQTPSTTGFNLEPFTGIIAWFNNAPGGFNMPIANAWEFLATIGVVGLGILTYIKTKVFFVTFVVVFLATVAGVGLHVMQGILVGIEIVIAVGVWAIDKQFQ